MSLSKSESARINGAKSRGPKTLAGKAKSSRNAIKHGLFAKIMLLRNENAEAFDGLTEKYIRRFQPRDGLELNIVEQMVAATWRLARCWDMQTQSLNLEMDNDQIEDIETLAARSFHTAIGNTPSLQLLHRFENSYERIFNRAIRTLANVRKNFPMPDDDTQKCENEPTAPFSGSSNSCPDPEQIAEHRPAQDGRSHAGRDLDGVQSSSREGVADCQEGGSQAHAEGVRDDQAYEADGAAEGGDRVGQVAHQQIPVARAPEERSRHGQHDRRLLQSLKGFTAREANRVLGRTGEPFWQAESYDHWVRNEREYLRIADYIECNPVKAGLVGHAGDYPWSSANPDQRLDTIVEAAECAQHGQNLIG